MANQEVLGIKVEFVDAVTRGLLKTANLSKKVAISGAKIGAVFLKAGKQLQRAFAGAGRMVGGFIVVVNQLLGIAGKMFRGFVSMANAVWSFIKAGAEMERVNARLANTVASVGHESGITTKAMELWSREISAATGSSRLLIKEGQAILATFTQVGPGVFKDATEVLVDMSEQGFGGMKENAIRLGKALNDPILGVTALREVGTSFTPAAVAFVKALVQENKVLEAQSFILKQVKKELGGAARAMKNTLLGRVNSLRTAWEDLSMTVGSFVAQNPVLNNAITTISGTFYRWSASILQNKEVQELLGSVIDRLVHDVAPALLNFLASILKTLPKVVGWFQTFINVLRSLWAGAKVFFDKLSRGWVNVGLIYDQVMKDTAGKGFMGMFGKGGDQGMAFLAAAIQAFQTVGRAASSAGEEFGKTFTALEEGSKEGALTKFLTLLASTGGPIGELAEKLRKVSAQVATLTTGVKGGVKDAVPDPTLWENFFEGMELGWKSSRDSLANLETQTRLFAATGKRVFEDWFSSSRDAFQEFFSAIAEGNQSMREMFSDLGDALRRALANALIQGLADVVTSKFFGMIAALLPGLGKMGGAKVGPTPNEIEDTAHLRQIDINTRGLAGGNVTSPGPGGDPGAAGGGFFSSIGSFLSNLATGLLTVMGSIGTAIMSLFTGVGTILLNIFSGVASLLLQALTSLGSGFMGLFGFHSGGEVRGPGGVDNVPAALTDGEFVVSKSAVNKYGLGFLHSLNNKAVPQFANGGLARRGYASGGYASGGRVSGGGPVAAPVINFSIQAHDASGFDRLLAERRGEIVSMVREGMLTQPGFRSQIATIAQTSR